MSTEVRTPDVTGALWRLPPVLCGLAAGEASRPVYLSVSSLLFQKGPVAPAVAVTAPQQTPVVVAPQALAQPASQPVQPPQTGIASPPGGPVVSQVRTLRHPSPTPPPSPPPLHPQGRGHCHSCQQAGCVTSSAPDQQPRRLTQLAMHPESHTCPHTFALIHSHKCMPTQGHADIKAQTHGEFRDTRTHRYSRRWRYTHTLTHSQISTYHSLINLTGATMWCHWQFERTGVMSRFTTKMIAR